MKIDELIEAYLSSCKKRFARLSKEGVARIAYLAGFLAAQSVQSDGLTVCENCGGWLKGGECENCNSPLAPPVKMLGANMRIVEIENEAESWKVEDAEIWYHPQKKLYYCWSCGMHYCEHVAQLRMHMTTNAKVLRNQ